MIQNDGKIYSIVGINFNKKNVKYTLTTDSGTAIVSGVLVITICNHYEHILLASNNSYRETLSLWKDEESKVIHSSFA